MNNLSANFGNFLDIRNKFGKNFTNENCYQNAIAFFHNKFSNFVDIKLLS